MDDILKSIQNHYNEFQDIVTEISCQYDESENHLNKIIELFEQQSKNNSNNETSAQQQSNSNNNNNNNNGKIIIKIKEPIELIKSILELVNNKLNKINDLLEVSKHSLNNQINNLNDINLISNRGKSKSEISIVDLIEFMTMILNNYEQDYQLKKILFDDIRDYIDPISNQLNGNLTIDKLNTTIPMWISRPLENTSNSNYINERLKLFNSILKLNK